MKDTNMMGDQQKIQFEDEPQRPRSRHPETPKIIRIVINHSGGLIKNKKQASYVLVGFAVFAIVVSVFLLFGSGENVPEKYRYDPETAPPDVNDFE